MSLAGYYGRMGAYIALAVLTFADSSWDQMTGDPARFWVRAAIAGLIAWRAFVDQSKSQLGEAK